MVCGTRLNLVGGAHFGVWNRAHLGGQGSLLCGTGFNLVGLTLVRGAHFGRRGLRRWAERGSHWWAGLTLVGRAPAGGLGGVKLICACIVARFIYSLSDGAGAGGESVC